MKKVLIISYYWPPAGGSGVQRPLKFVKYLRDFGWEPIVFTANNGEYPELDKTLEADLPEGLEIIRRDITEPYDLFRFFTGKKNTEKIDPNFFSKKKPGLLNKIAIFIRSNFFIPDAKMWWIKPSRKFLDQYLSNHKIDAIISTGPPHSLHLIAKHIKECHNIPWIADFRDPWTNIDYFKDLTLLPFAKNKHHKLERLTLQSADKVTCVAPTWAKELEIIGGRPVNVIYNGFDTSDFDNKETTTLNEKFTITHTGMYSKVRDHEIFWQALRQLVDEDTKFATHLELHFFGKTDPAALESAKKYNMLNYVKISDYLPHKDIVKVMASTRVLYLPINDTHNANGFIPGKVFEYFASKRPILCIGPLDGDSVTILRKSPVGFVSSFSDFESLKKNVKLLFNNYINQEKDIYDENIQQFSRRNLTKQLSELLNEISTSKN